MSERVTLPVKLALTGPMRRRTLAFISVSDILSSDSQPGMQACSTTGLAISGPVEQFRQIVPCVTPQQLGGQFRTVVLAVKAPTDYIDKGPQFARAMVEIGLLGGLVLVLTAASVLLRRKEREPEENSGSPAADG